MTEQDHRQEIERHLWAAIDLMAETLVKPDERIWGHLLVYSPESFKPIKS
jgi:hypothetical protein